MSDNYCGPCKKIEICTIVSEIDTHINWKGHAVSFKYYKY